MMRRIERRESEVMEIRERYEGPNRTLRISKSPQITAENIVIPYEVLNSGKSTGIYGMLLVRRDAPASEIEKSLQRLADAK